MRVLLAVLVVAVTLAACGSSAPPAGTPSPSPAALSPSPSVDPVEGSVAVRFRSSDGVRLTGRRFGESEVAVALSHHTDDDQSAWFDFAAELGTRGYQALTFNFRGVCSSTPSEACSGDAIDPNLSWSDVAGAVQYLRDEGAKAVFLIGASLGGEASIIAASKLGADVDGVIALSAPFGFVGLLDRDVERRMVASIDAPTLFMAGETDREFGQAARDFYASANEPKELRLFPLSDHGVALTRSAVADQVKDLIFRFLASNAPPAA